MGACCPLGPAAAGLVRGPNCGGFDHVRQDGRPSCQPKAAENLLLLRLAPQSGRISNFCRRLPGWDARSGAPRWTLYRRAARMRAALYTRVSTTDQNADMQTRELNEYAAR